MALPALLQDRLSVPVVASPMFLISTPSLVLAQCKAGIVGAMPALNARTTGILDDWLTQIVSELAAHDAARPRRPAAPFAINLIVHKSNARLDADLAVLAKHKVPIVITSLGAREEVNDAVHAWGGLVLHDVVSNAFARKAVQKGADGLIAVAAGAGGHAGTHSPFALLHEIREWFDGPLLLSGAIASGRAVLAAQAAGADLAYVGSAFIATPEANAADAYKQMIVDSNAGDIVYTNVFSGIHGNYLRPSIVNAGLDPDDLPQTSGGALSFSAGGSRAKTWKDIWGAGQGIGAVKRVMPTANVVARLREEYAQARCRLALEGGI